MALSFMQQVPTGGRMAQELKSNCKLCKSTKWYVRANTYIDSNAIPAVYTTTDGFHWA